VNLGCKAESLFRRNLHREYLEAVGADIG